MSYRLIDANEIAIFHAEVNDMPCIYADLPNGLDCGYYDMTERGEIVRCRDCAYYDGEPDMESMGEKCWRDPSHSGRSIPTVADGFCWRGERKEGGDE